MTAVELGDGVSDEARAAGVDQNRLIPVSSSRGGDQQQVGLVAWGTAALRPRDPSIAAGAGARLDADRSKRDARSSAASDSTRLPSAMRQPAALLGIARRQQQAAGATTAVAT